MEKLVDHIVQHVPNEFQKRTRGMQRGGGQGVPRLQVARGEAQGCGQGEGARIRQLRKLIRGALHGADGHAAAGAVCLAGVTFRNHPYGVRVACMDEHAGSAGMYGLKKAPPRSGPRGRARGPAGMAGAGVALPGARAPECARDAPGRPVGVPRHETRGPGGRQARDHIPARVQQAPHADGAARDDGRARGGRGPRARPARVQGDAQAGAPGRRPRRPGRGAPCGGRPRRDRAQRPRAGDMPREEPRPRGPPRHGQDARVAPRRPRGVCQGAPPARPGRDRVLSHQGGVRRGRARRGACHARAAPRTQVRLPQPRRPGSSACRAGRTRRMPRTNRRLPHKIRVFHAPASRIGLASNISTYPSASK